MQTRLSRGECGGVLNRVGVAGYCTPLPRVCGRCERHSLCSCGLPCVFSGAFTVLGAGFLSCPCAANCPWNRSRHESLTSPCQTCAAPSALSDQSECDVGRGSRGAGEAGEPFRMPLLPWSAPWWKVRSLGYSVTV